MALNLDYFDKDLLICNTCRCGFCRDECPWYMARKVESASPKGVMEVIQAYREGVVKPSQQLLDRISWCFGCRYCKERCPPSNLPEKFNARVDPGGAVKVLRYELRKKGYTMGKSAETVNNNVKKTGNPFGVAKKERAKWAEGLDLKKKGKRIFFASCMNPLMGYGETILKISDSLEKFGMTMERLSKLTGILEAVKLDRVSAKLLKGTSKNNEKYINSLRNSAKVLKKLGIEFGYLGEDEPCCGSSFYTYGDFDSFESNAREVYKNLKERGVEEIITLNPICGGVFKNYYPEFIPGFDIKVKHFVEVVAEEVDRQGIELKLDNEMDIAWHDPCYLARYMGVTKEVRTLLRSIKGLNLREPEATGNLTRCDGGGGPEIICPDIAKGVAEYRVKELMDTGASVIATSCPACVMMLEIGKAKNYPDVSIFDISDIISMAL